MPITKIGDKFYEEVDIEDVDKQNADRLHDLQKNIIPYHEQVLVQTQQALAEANAEVDTLMVKKVDIEKMQMSEVVINEIKNEAIK